jgi:hypothetical protein
VKTPSHNYKPVILRPSDKVDKPTQGKLHAPQLSREPPRHIPQLIPRNFLATPGKYHSSFLCNAFAAFTGKFPKLRSGGA